MSVFGWYHHHHHHHLVSCHTPSLPATSPPQPTAIPTAQGSSFALQHFPEYMRYSNYSCLFIEGFSVLCLYFGRSLFFLPLAIRLLFQHVNWRQLKLIEFERLLLTNVAIYLYSCIIYSTVYSPAVLSFHKLNWIQQHCICTEENDRYTNFPFTVIILFCCVICCYLLSVCFSLLPVFAVPSVPVALCQHTKQ